MTIAVTLALYSRRVHMHTGGTLFRKPGHLAALQPTDYVVFTALIILLVLMALTDRTATSRAY